jgi:DNA-binding Lrp family transcriptional regulator
MNQAVPASPEGDYASSIQEFSHVPRKERRGRTMTRHKLDTIDRQILSILQSAGRMTNVELASHVKITAPPCLRRVRALENSGYINGYHADIEPKSLGYEVAGFAFVGLASQAEADLRAFEEEVRNWPQVRSCYMLSGEVDFILRCVARDLPEFQSFITETLTATKNVASVKTALAIRRSKYAPGIPIDITDGNGAV